MIRRAAHLVLSCFGFLGIAALVGCRRHEVPAAQERDAAPPPTVTPASASVSVSAAPAPAVPPPAPVTLPSAAQLVAPFRGHSVDGFVAVTIEGARRVVALPSGAPESGDGDRPVLVASFTKLWTAVAALRFVGRGELGLETTIGDVLPALASRPWARSTLLELLTHTSLVPEFDDHVGFYGRRDVDFSDPENVLAAYVPRAWVEKRGVFKYRNAELALVGAMLAKKAGAPAADVLRREIWAPAKMEHAGLLVGATRPPELDLAPAGSVRAQNFFTAGAGYASARDLLAFFEALGDETLLDAAGKAKLEAGDPARGHGALGCWASSLDGSLLVERPGSFGNVRLFSAFFPERHRAVIAWSRAPLEMGKARSGRGIGYELTEMINREQGTGNRERE
jgi:CubicO group peptidase (beta-lactamase class C family)